MCEDGRDDFEVERFISVGEAKMGGIGLAIWIVVPMH
jgi:hypothetical protein